MPRTKAVNRTSTDRLSSDLVLLRATVGRLIGRTCWKVAFTYGGELTLHFGRHIAYGIAQLRGKTRGEWLLGTRGTAWKIFTPDGVVSSDRGSEEVLEAHAKILEGRRVTNFSVAVPDNVLTISFGREYLFRVTPTPADDKYELPYWELFMPDHKFVTFGPGSRWTYGRSDVPMT